MPDQTAKRITNILIGLCATMGLPRIIRSDQWRNFESAILHQTLQAFGVTNLTLLHITLKGMGWLND